ncbi:MAG TPA: DNRLRE domain-containing protein [Candidatus Polarisedimenticolaceae bacterium]|nr:DNRLRE domain-containing protein [Candidatus Polarisedimenticolaceae bacterium]
MKHHSAAGGLLVILALTGVRAETVRLTAVKDNTLFEDSPGALSNGAGPALFAGRINGSVNSIRRAVLAFDPSAMVPAGAIVTRATLGLTMSRTSAGPKVLRLHRVLADWGESGSFTGGGGGAPAQAGDATWIHRFFDSSTWATAGGDYDPEASAEQLVDQPGAYVWESAALAADVQSWLDDPAANAGWILIGDESVAQSVKLFESRESADPVRVPFLEIDYLPACAPQDPRGLGYWHRRCQRLEPDFVETVLPCAAAALESLGLDPDVCAALRPLPASDACARAERTLATLAFNVCDGRIQLSCPADPREACPGPLLLDVARQLADAVAAGTCDGVAGCLRTAVPGTPDLGVARPDLRRRSSVVAPTGLAAHEVPHPLPR